MSELVNAGNNHRFRLSSSMSENDTDLPFDPLTFEGTAPEDFPFLLTINNGRENMEIVKVIGYGSDAFNYEVERGQEGTEPQNHDAGSLVENNFTAGTYHALADELDIVAIEDMQNDGNSGYIKYKNGTLKCWDRVEITRRATGRMGVIWEYPKPYIDSPNIQMTIDYTTSSLTPTIFIVTAMYVRRIDEKEADLAVVRLSGDEDFGDDDYMHVFVTSIGRWK